MEYKSEIRESQVNALFDKVNNRNYGKYLMKIRLNPIRGFSNEYVTFDFPVTALIGPNGGGKTTVLGAAACAYYDIRPGRFFAKSGSLDNSMQHWKINYEAIDREVVARDLINRTVKFTNLKWTRDKVLKRTVAVFGVSRTVPANERTELKKCASNSFPINEDQIQAISETVIDQAQKILGKNLSGYSTIKVGASGRLSLLKGQTERHVSFSEFHFGAGESSIIRMLMEIESLPDNSLILIEEIENGLHPIATIRMVEYLIELAGRKGVQVIFTTHSNEALKPLPSKAIWAVYDNKTFQGKLDVRSLRKITVETECNLIIYVEDDYAKQWVEAIISSDNELSEQHIRVYAVYGDGTAVKIHKNHNTDPASKCKSICIIDGDSQQRDDVSIQIYRLPSQMMPERYIFEQVQQLVNQADSKIGELTIALHKNFTMQDTVKKVIDEVGLTCRDGHTLFNQIALKLNYMSDQVVKSAFLNLWIQYFPSDVNVMIEHIKCNISR